MSDHSETQQLLKQVNALIRRSDLLRGAAEKLARDTELIRQRVEDVAQSKVDAIPPHRSE